MNRAALGFLLLLATGVVAGGALHISESWKRNAWLESKLAETVPPSGRQALPCMDIARTRPLVILALGQSNAGNHGIREIRQREAITVLADGKCWSSGDPLPGATGKGGSVWSRLPAQLSAYVGGRPIVLSVLAVDATSIDDWTRPGSPLRTRLVGHLASLRALDLPPQLILWQQGEAETRAGTRADDYFTGLDKLAAIIDGSGQTPPPPILLARSTVCRSPGNATIRSVIETKTSSNKRFLAGPDTDILVGEAYRSDGCHFSEGGIVQAARMWAEAIVKADVLPLRQDKGK